MSSLLGEGVDSGKVELNISFDAAGQSSASFSVWSWNSAGGATEIYKTIGFPATAQTIDFSKNVVLSSSDKLFVVWNDNSGGSSNTITNLTSSYAVSTNYATLYWRGGDATWSSTSTTWNATSSETIGNVAATSFDDVIFDSSATVAVDSGGVAVDTLAISSGTVSFSGGAVAVKSGLALSDGTTLSLNGTSVNTGSGTTTIGANAQLTVSGDGALNTTITSVGSNAQLVLGGTGANAVTLNGAIGAGAAVNVSSGTLSGTITSVGSNAQLVLGGTGANAVTLNGAIGAGAAVNVSSGTLSGTITSMGLGSSLTLAGTDANNKSTVSISGGKKLSGSLTIGNATVNVSAQNDTFDWGNNTRDQLIVLNEGGTLNFGEKRQSLNSRVKFTLKGGTIIGAGDADGAMDFYKENTVKVTADSSIEASIRLRSDGGSGDLTFDVDDGATLTVSGVINKKKDNNTRKIVKTGYGKMILSGDNSNYSNGGFSIQKGTLVAQSATALGSGAIAIANVGTLELAAATGTFSNVISGAGAIKKTGTGTVTLAGENIYTGSTTIERGVLVAAHASALGASTATTTVNSGGVLKIAVNGGLTAGTVTLNQGALLAIDLTAYSNVEEGTALTIISSSAISFNSQEFSSDLMENTFFDLENSNLGSWSSYLREWSYDGSTLSLTMTIPEPSTFGLLAGLGALALAGTRRRRKKA